MKKYILIGLLILLSFAKSNQFISGVDISMLKQVEENGGLFYENGNQIDPVQLFKDKGINTARIKIWHTPSLNYNNLESVLEIANRANNVGLDLLLDFHYSDTWADPSNQTKPSAWVDLTFATLCDSVEQYSRHVITKLKNQNTLPKYVQIGNETDCGLLWPDGYVCDEYNNDSQWNQLRELFMHAIEGVNSALDAQDTLEIISHVSSGGNWFFNNLIEQGVDIDILSISYYPMWHGTLTDLIQNMDELGNTFQKPVLIVETAYPFTLQWNDNTNNILGGENQLLENYEASEEGQFLFLHDLITLVNENDHGLGICYWAPDWISTNQFGSPWENQALFDFDGELLDAISVFDNSIDSTSIEGRWLIPIVENDPGNTMYEFLDGLRYTYYCTEDNGCDTTYWNSLDTSDAIPNPNPYTFLNDTLSIDMFFGNIWQQSVTFECDGNIVSFGDTTYWSWWRVGLDTSECEEQQLELSNTINSPATFKVNQNYPNPFNPVTTLRYDLPKDSFVSITIYDMLGNVINNLVSSNQSLGYKSVQWNATNNQGQQVSAGLYIYTIEAGEFRQTKKMILLK